MKVTRQQQMKSLEQQIKELAKMKCGAEVNILWVQLNILGAKI